MSYKFTSQVKEEHGLPLFGVQFNWYLEEVKVFATVGSNRATIYSCNSDSSNTALQAYSDADADENFYTCAWSYDTETGESLLAIAGAKGIIRIIGTSTVTCRASYSGHGNAINELKVHPTNPQLLLSASKDHALRLWNLKTSVCVAIFGGVEGHRDEVLSADFNLSGTRILSGGMDHALKLWEADTPKLQQVIRESSEYQRSSKRSFPTLSVHFPTFSTRDIHRNYVDSVCWFGQLALSKSCENCIVLWKPPGEGENAPTVLHKLEVSHCDIWFIRFCLDYRHEMLVLGNQVGKILVWDLTVDEPNKLKYSCHFSCVTSCLPTTHAHYTHTPYHPLPPSPHTSHIHTPHTHLTTLYPPLRTHHTPIHITQTLPPSIPLSAHITHPYPHASHTHTPHRPHTLSHPKCITAIRQVTISKDRACLLSVCDNGTIWRWDRREGKK